MNKEFVDSLPSKAVTDLLGLAILRKRVGSRVTCDPAPTNTDIDYLALVRDAVEFKNIAVSLGWVVGGSMPTDPEVRVHPDDEFISFKLGEDNVIATSSIVFYDRFIAATSVCKRLNLMDKQDRIALFQAVLYAKGEL